MSGVMTLREFFFVLFALVDAKRPRQIGIELARRHWSFAGVTLLRRFAEAARHRGAGAMRICEIGAAIERIIRRGLDPSAFVARLAFSWRLVLFFPSPRSRSEWRRGVRGWGHSLRVCVSSSRHPPRRFARGGKRRLRAFPWLNPGLRADAGAALADGGVQQIGQGRIDRRRVRPRCLCARRFGWVFLRMLGWIAQPVGPFRHGLNMGRVYRREKCAPSLLAMTITSGPLHHLRDVLDLRRRGEAMADEFPPLLKVG